jgi:PleD family two-component response regulator
MPLFNRSKKSKNSENTIKKKVPIGIYSQEEFKKSVGKERARADRSNQKLSLIIFDMNSSAPKKIAINQLFAEIRSRVRNIDQVGWYDDQQLGIILPYTSNRGAIRLTENICESLDESISKPICSVYTYPLDSLDKY